MNASEHVLQGKLNTAQVMGGEDINSKSRVCVSWVARPSWE